MRILVLLAVVGAACAAPSLVAPYPTSVPTVPEPAPAHVPVAAFPPVTYITRHHAQDELGQVNYGFSHPGQVKNEVRDALGNVAGAYSYIDADNKPVHVQYTAGFDGFQVRSNNLPVGPTALDAPEPIKDTPEVFSAKQEFVEAYNTAAIAAAAASDDDVISKPAVHSSGQVVLKAAVDSADEVVLEPAVDSTNEVVLEPAVDSPDQVVSMAAVNSADEVVLEPAVDSADEVVLEPAVDSADAVFKDDVDEDVETATMLGIVADTFINGDEDPALEIEEDTSALVEIKQAYKPNDDELVPPADTPESVLGVSIENIEAKAVPKAEEETVPDTIETRYTIEGVPDGTVDAAPLPETDGPLPEKISIEPFEVQPNLAGIDDNAHFRTIEVSELFPTLEAGPIAPQYTSETAVTKADFQAISKAAEDTPVFNLDGSITRYSGYLPPVHGSVSPLYTNTLPYRAYGIHVPVLIPYTMPGNTKQTSYIAPQTPMPYYRFVPRNYIYRVPYASQFLNYISLKDC